MAPEADTHTLQTYQDDCWYGSYETQDKSFLYVDPATEKQKARVAAF